jgi:hypothetical protein
MWKALKTRYIVLALSMVALSAAAEVSHQESFQKNFPYGLIGEDYGILSLNDLALNACKFKPVPLTPEDLTPYEYWQCFDVKNISLACEGRHHDLSEGMLGRVSIRTKSVHLKGKYVESRPWPLRDCRIFIKEIQDLLRNAPHVCISAYFVSEKKDKLDRISRFGLLGRIKTKKNCIGQSCHVDEKMRKEICPELVFSASN